MPRWILWAGVVLTLFFIFLRSGGAVDLAVSLRPVPRRRRRTGSRSRAHPSSEHLFGTNVQSTDVLSRVIYGAQTELKVVVLAVRRGARRRPPARPHLGLLRRAARPRARARHGCTLRVPISAARDRDRVPARRPARSGGADGRHRDRGGVHAAVLPGGAETTCISVREEPYVEAARALGARPRTVISSLRLPERDPERARDRHPECRRRHPDAGRAGLPRLRHPAHRGRRVGVRQLRARSPTPAPGSGGRASSRASRSCCSSRRSRCSARA